MRESKLIELLESLSVEELKIFGSHLEKSSSKNSGVYKLYTYLKKLHPDYPEKKVEKQVVFKKIMPKGKTYNDKSLRDLMSKITLALESFLLQIELESNEVEKDFLMLSLLKKRKRDKLFFQKVTQIERKWKKQPTPGIEHYHNEFRLLEEYHAHPYTNLKKDKKVSNNDLIRKLDEYYFANKLYHTMCAIQTEKVLNNKFDFSNNLLIKEINNLRHFKYLNRNFHINIFGHSFDAYMNNDYNNYTIIKKLYFDHIQEYSFEEKFDLFVFLQHYCYENYRLGNEDFLGEIFELNKFAVEQDFLRKDNAISTDMFRNIVQLGCSVGEFEWVDKFITEYQEFLEWARKDDIVTLCKAVLDFYQGNYEETLNKLLIVRYQDPLYALQVRCLQLQSYYELSEYEELFFNLINSFSVFLSRDTKLPEAIRQATLNFVQFSNKLYKFKYAGDKNLVKVIDELEKCKVIVNKKWLLVKGEELLLKKKQPSL